MTCRPWSYDLCSSAMEEPPSATATETPRGLRLTLRLRALRTMRNEVDLPIGDFEETRSTCAGPSAAETRRWCLVFCTMLLLFDDENPLIELTDDEEEDATNLHIDKHSLLDSGILCCLIHILNAHLDPDEANQKQKATDRDEPFPTEKDYDGDAGQVRRLELLVQMVANGSLTVFSRHKESPILVLLLVNDNRSTAKYISRFLCCLIHILNALLDPDEANQKKKATDRDELFKSEEDYDGDAGQVRRLEVALT
ncbi:hypothetical protein PS1_008225 [Malus domestica]